MKKIIYVFSLLLVVVLSFNQMYAQETDANTKDLKKLEKSEKKKIREEAERNEWEKARVLAESKRFVFQASEMFTSEGTIPLDQKTNFFYVIDNEAVIQFTFMGLQSVPNPNGLGGITTEGEVTKYEIKADNYKKPVRINLSMKPEAGQGRGIYQLSVTIFGDDYAELLLTNNGVRLKGIIIQPEDSRIFQGTAR